MECHVTGRHGGFSLDIKLDLEADPHWIGIFGPSGAGKSTMLRALAGLLPTFQSRGKWGKTDFSEHQNVVLVSAQTPLFPALTVRKNLVVVADCNGASPEQFEAIITLCECAQLLDKMPDSLSGGELQRVKLARALLAAPTLLLLDESFSAMDKALKQRVLGGLQELTRTNNIRVIVVSHDLQDIILSCEQMAVLHNGRVIAQGSIAAAVAKLTSMDAFSFPLCSVIGGPFVRYQEGLSVFMAGEHEVLMQSAAQYQPGDPIQMMVLASHISLSLRRAEIQDKGLILQTNNVPVKVSHIVSEGERFRIHLDLAGQPLWAYVDSWTVKHLQLTTGDELTAHFSSGQSV